MSDLYAMDAVKDRILVGDCLDNLRKLPDASVDLVFCRRGL